MTHAEVQARWSGLVILVLLTGLALVLRLALDISGVLDTDAVNFGLAALSFDVLQHQPHPPGYPGYVLLLKLIHLVAPGLSPLEIAKWGSRLCGVATVPATFWAAGKLLEHHAAPDRRQRSDPDGTGALALVPVRRLMAAAFATVTPVLWYYGADGQSHAAEALATILLFGAVADARSRADLSRLRVLALVGAIGLAGAIRPSVVFLGSPILLWLLWRRPFVEWALGLVVGLVATATWLVPVVALTGGWDLYRRAANALFQLFYDSYSVFGARTTASTLLANAGAALWALAFCLAPLVALSRPRRMPTWGAVALAVAGVTTLFYAMVYVAEAGYLSGVAALVCLVPATWPRPVPRGLALRGAAGLVGAVAFVLLGPANVWLPDSHRQWPAPTLGHALEVEALEAAYHRAVCGATAGEPALVITDNPTTTHTRALAATCPRVIVGVFLHRDPLQPSWDNWLIFDRRGMQVLPPPVPLEPGPPAEGTLMRPVARVIVSPDARPRLRDALRQIATCPPAMRRIPRTSIDIPVFPARCLPVLSLGKNILRVPALER